MRVDVDQRSNIRFVAASFLLISFFSSFQQQVRAGAAAFVVRRPRAAYEIDPPPEELPSHPIAQHHLSATLPARVACEARQTSARGCALDANTIRVATWNIERGLV
jgi:hypothetical protein